MCTEKYVYPFTDFGFKLLFGSVENKEFLISFLNSLLGRDDKFVGATYRQTLLSSERQTLTSDLRCISKAFSCQNASGGDGQYRVLVKIA